MPWTIAMIRCAGACLPLSLTVLLAGCQQFVNPWHDAIAQEPPVTTKSADYAKALNVQPEVRRRDFEEATVLLADGTVTHGALYFEDPLETARCDDGRFAWTALDHAYIVGGPFRYLLNGAFMPVSVIDTPPWKLMASDGEPSRNVQWMPHDAGVATVSSTQ